MLIEQIAVVADPDFIIQDLFATDSVWTRDLVTAKGILHAPLSNNYIPIENKAELRFNYNVIPGKEFELLHYYDGPNFHGHRISGTISHFGLHVDKIDDHFDDFASKGFTIIQEVVTVRHTNVPSNRRYHYAIFQHPKLHLFIKLIERLDPNTWLLAKEEMERRYDCVIF